MEEQARAAGAKQPRVLLERLRLTDKAKELLLPKSPEKKGGTKRLWRPHIDELEEPLERMAVEATSQAAVQPPPDQVTGSAGMTPPAPPQVEVGEPSVSKYSGFSTLYLEKEAEAELEKAQAEARTVAEDEEVDVEVVDVEPAGETVTSELEIKPEAIQTEEEAPICNIQSVCSLNPEAVLADDEGTEQVFKIQAVLSDHPLPAPVKLHPPQHLFLSPGELELAPAVIKLGTGAGPMYVRARHPAGEQATVMTYERYKLNTDSKAPIPVPGLFVQATLAKEPLPGPSTGPQGRAGPSGSGQGPARSEPPLPPTVEVRQNLCEQLTRNSITQALAELGDLRAGHTGKLWDIRAVGRAPYPDVSPVKDMIGKLMRGEALSQEELLDCRTGYHAAVRIQVDNITAHALDTARRLVPHLAILEAQYVGGVTPPCPTCRRTNPLEARPATTGSQATEPRKKFAGVLIGTRNWITPPSYLNENWATLSFTSEEEASLDGLTEEFPTEAQLRQTRLFQGLQQRMEQLGSHTEFPILIEYAEDKGSDGQEVGNLINFIRTVGLIQRGRLQPIIVVYPPAPYQPTPTDYQLCRNQYYKLAKKLRTVGRALGVAVYIPFVQAHIVTPTAAVTPRYSTGIVLYLENGGHTTEMERRIRNSLAELSFAMRPFLVPSVLWANAHTVAPFVGAWC
jgi:hypothetical protein